MATQLLNLPVNIPWCQLGVTQNMMDIRIGNDKFPAPWRSSIAISVYEPPTEDLPEQYTNKVVTYIKATCSITGYQPSKKEQEEGEANLDDRFSDFRFLWEEYLACYGVLLNISVLPARKDAFGRVTVGGRDLSLYPHIVGLEPKNRDLYQSATETGEILTASKSAVQTDKTSVTASSSETGITGGYGSKEGPNIGLSHKWGNTESDSISTQTDSSRERRETEGTTTQLSQMYNLLTGYHQGTNRATFLMLPRPHVLQPTNRRTFVQGLRAIEGIQEFFLVVVRPKEVSAMCIESFLETGHYPEDVSFEIPDTPSQDIAYAVNLNPIRFRVAASLDERRELGHFFDNGFLLDLRGGLGPIEEIIESEDNLTSQNLRDYSFNVEGTTFVLKGILRTGSVFGSKTYHRSFRVHFRKPLSDEPEARVSIGQLLITKRGLSVCFESSNPCRNILLDSDGPAHIPELPEEPNEFQMWADNRSASEISGESQLNVHPEAIRNLNSNPAALTNEVLRALKKGFSTNNNRYEQFSNGIPFMETDYFQRRVKTRLSKDVLDTPLSEIRGIKSYKGFNLPKNMTIATFLDMDFSELVRASKLTAKEVMNVRKEVLMQIAKM